MVSGPQIRSARGLLGVSARELAKLSNVSWATIQRFETTDEIPKNRSGTLDRVKAALEAEGIEFLGDPISSPGVQLNRKPG
jgi:DNA-binding transcriptional regulator YiaG